MAYKKIIIVKSGKSYKKKGYGRRRSYGRR